MATLLELTSDPAAVGLHIEEILAKIADQYRAASTWEQRESLLALHFSCLNIAESKISDGAALEKFRDSRRRHYRALLVSELSTTDGVIDDPSDLRRITTREVTSGRMSPDDDLHYLAINGVPRPAAHVNSTPTPQATPGLLARIKSPFR